METKNLLFIDLFYPGTLEQQCLFNELTIKYSNVFKVEKEELLLYCLQAKIPDIIILNPVLPPTFLFDSKIKFVTLDLPKGIVGFELFKKIIKLTELAGKKPKIILYTVTPFKNLVEVGFPENMESFYIQKPAFTADVIEKIEE